MNETILTRQRILEAAEEVLRRYGPGKTTVVDVARALGVSHGSVYNHFASKAELREAVVQVWLARVNGPLEAVVAAEGPAPQRLRRWLETLIGIKRSRASDDPELFATYLTLASEARDVVREHQADLATQISRIIRDGVTHGEFVSADSIATARAVLTATTRFHNPAHALEWTAPGIDAAFGDVWALILNGLQTRSDTEP